MSGLDLGPRLPVDVVGDEGRVEEDAEPLAGDEEEKVEDDVQNVSAEGERVETEGSVVRAGDGELTPGGPAG
jgi:hypothetical protein